MNYESYGGDGGNVKDDRTTGERLRDYFVNDGPKAVLIVIWVLGNLAVFFERYYEYCLRFREPFIDDEKNLPARETTLLHVFNIMDQGVCLARGSAAAIKLDSALLMVMVLRNFLSWLRGTFVGTYLPVDKNIVFHRNLAWTIAFWTAMHCVAHFSNFYLLSVHTDKDDLGALGFEAAPPAEALAYMTIPGVTGYIALFAMVLMYASAIKFVRGPSYNIFFFIHITCFMFYYGALMIHGAVGLLEPPTFWMWTVGPLLLYFVERLLRVLRGNQDTILQLAVAHPSGVVELQMKKSSFTYKPGQFLYLNCPYIAEQEWHPFTISSAPEEDAVSVHIKVVGDWTGDLSHFLNPDRALGVVQENLLTAPDGTPIFKIDGPYGAASEEVFDFRIVVLVAAGIGVTPFASILKSIRYKLESGAGALLQKVFFFWVARDRNAFEWFAEILSVLERANVNNFLEIQTYLTGQLSTEEIRSVMHSDKTTDTITGLQSQTNFGRPNWQLIFNDLATKYMGQEIAVFCCGPRTLSKPLYKQCTSHTSTRTNTKFVFHKENF